MLMCRLLLLVWLKVMMVSVCFCVSVCMLVIRLGMCDIGIIMFLLILFGVMLCSVGDSVLCVV